MDPAAFRARFPVLERTAYLNAGSCGPLPAAASEAAREAVELQARDGRTRAHFEARVDAAARLRAIYALRLGCDELDVAITTSTSEGIGKALTGLGLEPGDEVLTSDQEHPGVIGPLLAARERGVEVRTAPLAELASHVTAETTAVCCSHVGWVSGLPADPALAEVDVPVVLDGAQGVGAIPVDVHALNCAAYAGAGQKWLCGADGTGMLYVAKAWQDRITAFAPGFSAMTDHAGGLASGLEHDARRHDTPTLAREVGVASLAAAGELEAFGWDALHERAASLAEWFAGELAERGRTVAPRGRTTLVAWEDPEPEATVARLAEKGVAIRYLPATPYVRASIGAWNDEDDLTRLLEAL
jgi:L-cysteine/cystine lyase